MNHVQSHLLHGRITRRQLLGAGAASTLGIAGLALVGCGGGGGGATTPTTAGTPEAEGTPKPGGILRLRQTVPYPNLSPFGAGISNLLQALFVGFTIYDHLWYVPTDTGEVVLFLATDYEIIDPLTIRFTMGDAVFHNKPPVNGRAVTPNDVQASIERFREVPPVGFSWLREIFDYLETPDEKTVVYHQKRPWAWFFTSSNAGSPISSSILPAEVIDDDRIVEQDPIGSGRWVLAGHDNFTNIKLRKFENWREPGLPYLDGIDYTLITDDTLAEVAFRAQDIDSVGVPNSRALRRLEQDLGDRIRTSSDLARSYATLMLKYEEPFLDPRVRHGINLALNRQEIIDLVEEGDAELCGPLPPAHKVFVLDEDDPDLQEYFRYDPQEAKQMLEAAGFPFDQEIALKHHSLPPVPDLAQVIAEQLRDIGLNVVLPPAEDITRWLAETLGPGNFQMTTFIHLPYEDPSLPLSFYRPPNFMGYADDDVTAAFEAAATEMDEEARIEKTKEAQRVIIRQWGPMLNLYSPVTFGARWAYYKGVVEGRGSFGLFNSRAWLDK